MNKLRSIVVSVIETIECNLTKIIIKDAQEHLIQIIAGAMDRNILVRHTDVPIPLNCLQLCHFFPEETHSALNDLTKITLLIKQLIKKIVLAYLSSLGVSSPGLLSFYEIFNIRVYPYYLPINEYNQTLEDIYKIFYTSKNLCITLKGDVRFISHKQNIKSQFYKCVSQLCMEKSYVLKTNKAYTFIESQPSTLLVSSEFNDKCKKCKSALHEDLSKRMYVNQYTYCLNSRSRHISLICDKEIREESTILGFIERSKNGVLCVCVYASYQEKMEENCYKLVRERSALSISEELIKIASFIFKNIKMNCIEADAILLLILNIPMIRKCKLLLYTNDPGYVRLCALHFFKVKNKKIGVYLSLLPIKCKSGLFIRHTSCIDQPVLQNKADHIFYLPVSQSLNYTYSLYDEIHRLEERSVWTYDETVNKEIQLVYVELRKVFRSLIRPEKLLELITCLFMSLNDFLFYKFESSRILQYLKTLFENKIVPM